MKSYGSKGLQAHIWWEDTLPKLILSSAHAIRGKSLPIFFK